MRDEERPTTAPARPVQRVIALSALLALAATAILTTLDVDASARSAPLWFALCIAVMFGLAEHFAFHVEYRREAVSFTLSEVPAAFALLFLGPVAAVAVRVISSQWFFRSRSRPTLPQIIFNSTLYAFETVLAFAVLQFLCREVGSSDGHLLLAIGSALAIATCAGSALVSVAIACFEGRFVERLTGEMRTSMVFGPIAAAVGALALAPALIGLEYAPLAVLPVVTVWLILHQHGQLSEQHRKLNAVHDFTRRIGQSIRLTEFVPRALDESVQLLHADTGSLELPVVACPEGWTHLRCVASPGHPARLLGVSGPSASALADDAAWEAATDARLADGAEPLRMPIVDGQGQMGTLVLTGRANGEFDAADMARAEHVAEQLAVSLRNSLMHAQAERDALRDPLTGNLNRAGFDQQVTAATETTTERCAAVMMLDLDRFKEVNDTLGHHTGDQVLVEFSARLAAVLEPGDLLARFGGDEYAILVERDSSREVVDFAQCLVDASRAPFLLGGFNVVVAASVGVAFVEPGDSTNDIVRRSDIAMYTAKAQHTGYEVYSADIDRRTPERLSLLGDLRIALDQDELDVHYQPKLDLATASVIGVEALVRWDHPVRGWIPPDEFIPVAEESGLVKAITDRVLTRAARDTRSWLDAGFDLTVSVNLSTLDLVDELLPDRVERSLRAHDLEPSRLTLEITESSLMLDTPRTMLTVERLARLGVGLALDDFGTGYSSLSYLRRLPVTELKIDRSFISNLLLDPQDEAIVTSTILLGHNLGLQIVAEGVKTPEISARLLELACDVAQGFGISRPLPAATLLTWLHGTGHAVQRSCAPDHSLA